MSGRSSKLDQVLEKALTKSLEHLDEQKFYSYFSFCDAPSCQRLRNALIGNITTAVKDEYNTIVSERGLKEQLQKLDQRLEREMIDNFIDPGSFSLFQEICNPKLSVYTRKVRTKAEELLKLEEIVSQMEKDSIVLEKTKEEQKKKKEYLEKKIQEQSHIVNNSYNISLK